MSADPKIVTKDFRQGVTEQFPNHRKALSEGQGAGRKGVAQVTQQLEDD